MSEIQHKSLKDELLYLIGRATAPMSSADLYEKCELADEVSKVAKALSNLRDDGKIVRIEGEGRARYKLAAGVAAPAPAGKTGRSKAVQQDDAAPAKPDDAAGLLTAGYGIPLTGIRPAPESTPPALDIPTLGDRPADAGKPMPNEAAAADDAAIAKGLDLVEELFPDDGKRASIKEALIGKQPGADAERLADAILERLKRQLAPTLGELEAAAGMDRVNVHIHIEQVDFHLGGL